MFGGPAFNAAEVSHRFFPHHHVAHRAAHCDAVEPGGVDDVHHLGGKSPQRRLKRSGFPVFVRHFRKLQEFRIEAVAGLRVDAYEHAARVGDDYEVVSHCFQPLLSSRKSWSFSLFTIIGARRRRTAPYSSRRARQWLTVSRVAPIILARSCWVRLRSMTVPRSPSAPKSPASRSSRFASRPGASKAPTSACHCCACQRRVDIICRNFRASCGCSVSRRWKSVSAMTMRRVSTTASAWFGRLSDGSRSSSPKTSYWPRSPRIISLPFGKYMEILTMPSRTK